MIQVGDDEGDSAPDSEADLGLDANTAVDGMRWLANRHFRPAPDNEINRLFDDAAVEEALAALKEVDLPQAARLVQLIPPGDESDDAPSGSDADDALSFSFAAPEKAPPVDAPDDALSFSFAAPEKAPPVDAPDDALSFSFAAPEKGPPVDAPDDALSFSFAAPEKAPPVDAPDDALSFSAPDDALSFSAPEKAPPVAAPDDALSFSAPDDALSFSAPDDALSFSAPTADPPPPPPERPGHDAPANTVADHGLPAEPAAVPLRAPAGRSKEVLFAARTDLTVEPLDDKFIIQDQKKNSFTQLGMGEYVVFRCFDGKSTLEDISRRLKEERGVVVTPIQVARFRDRLHEKQLVLAPGEVATAEGAKIDGGMGVIGKMAMIDLKIAFDADAFLLRLYHRIKHVVFRPAFFVGLTCLVGLAVTVWLRSRSEILLQLNALDFRESLPLFYVLYGLTAFIHETAHGVVCRGFGGKVPRIGMFFYFFAPAFYTDVSSSWMFPSKFRKLMVLFAGAISNLGVCAISTLVWRMTIQGSTVNHVAFVMMLINAFASTYTLIPLLTGDGYYIVSTLTNIPNLRRNSHQYVRAWARKKVIRTTELPKATRFEATFYLLYSPAEFLFFLVFGGYASYLFLSWFIGSLHLIGFLILAIVLIDGYGRKVFKRIVAGLLKVAADALRLGFSEGAGPLFALFTRPIRDAARAALGFWKHALAVIAVVVLLALLPYDVHISAPFEVISSGPVTVRAKAGGIVKAYAVSSGQWVKKGDVVALFIDDDLALQRKIVVAELEQARALLARLQAGYRTEEVAQASVGVSAQRKGTALAAEELRRVRMLHDNGISSPQELDEATASHQSAVALEQQARAQLQLLRAGYQKEEIELQRAKVERATLEVTSVDQRLEWTTVRALVDGQVVTPPYELNQRVGTHVAAGGGVIDIVAPVELVARLALPERFMSDVSVGMTIEMRFFNEADVAYVGKLDAIEPTVTARDKQLAGSLGMLSSLASLNGRMALGTKGIAKLEAGSQSVLGLILRRAHRAGWVVFWSWW